MGLKEDEEKKKSKQKIGLMVIQGLEGEKLA